MLSTEAGQVVASHTIDNTWGAAEKVLLDYPEVWERYYDLEDIHSMLLLNELQGWVFERPQALVLFALLQYPKGLALDVRFVAGTVGPHIGALVRTMEDVGRKLGADWIEGHTTPQLAHWMWRRMGYSLETVGIYKDLKRRFDA
jgi:hypothetical protein